MRPLRRLPALAALGCAMLAAWAAAPAPALAAAPHGAPAVGESGESGYVATGGRYTSVSAAWTQPQLACSTGASNSASYWVGLDGATDQTVEQAGTSSQCSGGTVSMYAWYELYPAFPVTFSNPVRAGDAMRASVTTDGSGSFTLTVVDATAGWTASAKKTLAGAGLSSAEVLTDVPSAGPSSPVTGSSLIAAFTSATANGASLALADPQVQQAPGTVVSPITSAGNFTVSWAATS